MSIPVRCGPCGQRLKAPDALAGKTVKCPKCAAPLTVPEPPPAELDPAALLLQADAESPVPTPPPRPAEPPAPVTPRKPSVATLPPLTTNDPPFWRRHLHWLLVLAMLPLAGSLLRGKPDGESIADRIDKSLERATPAERQRFFEALGRLESVDDLINALPGKRLDGAWLPRSTFAHWGMAAAAAALYLLFFMYLASDGSARVPHVLAVGLVTATAGVGLLLLVQWLASFTAGRVMVGKSVIVLLFYVLKFIEFSYSAASDPDNGFVLSFVGYTLGVGLLEELTKTLPLFWHRTDDDGRASWRGLFVWGLASGAGFGIAEGIMYSARYYNGVTGPGVYAVRFLSCVALHATWSGSVGVTLYLMRDRFDGIGEWHGWLWPTLAVIGVPMVLHGLFDTCLKKDQNAAALAVAVASFGFLAFLTSRLYGRDDEAAERAMLREYQRRRTATA